MKFLLYGCILFGVATLNASEGDRGPLIRFQDGIHAYESSDYPLAIENFETLLASGKGSGTLHYNLGDAYFRQNKLGESIFHFREAVKYLPRDPDIRYNLRYAREKVIDRIANQDDLTFLNSLAAVNEREALYLVLISALLFWSFAILALFLKNGVTRWGFRLSLVFLFFGLGIYQLRQNLAAPFGVVTAAEAEVFSGMGKDNVLLFSLHAGSEFEVSDSQDPEWIKLSLSDGKKGWIKKADVLFEEL